MAVGLIKGIMEVWLYLLALPSLSRWEHTAKANISITMTLDFPELWEISCGVVFHQLLHLRYFCFSISSAFQVRPSCISSDVPPHQEMMFYPDKTSPWDPGMPHCGSWSFHWDQDHHSCKMSKHSGSLGGEIIIIIITQGFIVYPWLELTL